MSSAKPLWWDLLFCIYWRYLWSLFKLALLVFLLVGQTSTIEFESWLLIDYVYIDLALMTGVSELILVRQHAFKLLKNHFDLVLLKVSSLAFINLIYMLLRSWLLHLLLGQFGLSRICFKVHVWTHIYYIISRQILNQDLTLIIGNPEVLLLLLWVIHLIPVWLPLNSNRSLMMLVNWLNDLLQLVNGFLL